MNEDSKVYEIGFHIVPTVEESKLHTVVEEIKKNLGGATVISEEAPKLVALEYSISKDSGTEHKRSHFNKAYFGWVKFEAEGEKISSIDSSIKDMKDVLRFIIVKTDKENNIQFHKTLASSKQEANSEQAPAAVEDLDKSIEDLVIS